MSHYIFDNAAQQANQRFNSLETLYDPWTISHLETTGIGPGWHCWEVGAGGGSIAAWLGEHCGPTGHVLVTDLDPRFLVENVLLDKPQIEIQRHDIANDPLPAQTFDLIHARLVLFHVPTREQALQRMMTALKPEGWLILDEYDRTLIDLSYPTTDAVASALYHKMFVALSRVMEARGIDLAWGGELVSTSTSAWPDRGGHGGIHVCVGRQVRLCLHDACELRTGSAGGHERRVHHERGGCPGIHLAR